MRHSVGPKGVHGLYRSMGDSPTRRNEVIKLGLAILQFEYDTQPCGCHQHHCSYCGGVGIIQAGGAAPASVLNRVLVVGEVAYKVLK